jgi:hypothetical protein
MQKWLDAETCLNAGEQYLFDLVFADACKNIDGWHEEDFKNEIDLFRVATGKFSR